MHRFLAKCSVSFIKSQRELTAEQEEIILYGGYILFLNVTKLSIVYVVAYLIGIAWEVFLVNIGFTTLRIWAYGYHAKSSITCTLFMLGGFYSLVYFGIYMPYVPVLYLMILPAISIALILRYAPAASENNPIKEVIEQRKKKKQSLICYLIVYTIVLVIGNNTYTTMITLGMFFETLTIIQRR